MSVAMGIPQPGAPAVPAFSAVYRPAGTSIPPTAAARGSAARLGEDSAPAKSSRLISRPTTKKNKAINPSLIQESRGLARTKFPKPIATFICHRPK